jgi:hypothetical protein
MNTGPSGPGSRRSESSTALRTASESVDDLKGTGFSPYINPFTQTIKSIHAAKPRSLIRPKKSQRQRSVILSDQFRFVILSGAQRSRRTCGCLCFYSFLFQYNGAGSISRIQRKTFEFRLATVSERRFTLRVKTMFCNRPRLLACPERSRKVPKLADQESILATWAFQGSNLACRTESVWF